MALAAGDLAPTSDATAAGGPCPAAAAPFPFPAAAVSGPGKLGLPRATDEPAQPGGSGAAGGDPEDHQGPTGLNCDNNSKRSSDKCNKPNFSVKFWNINGVARFFNTAPSDSIAFSAEDDAIFFIESWLTDPKSMLKEKDYFFSPAEKTGSRPSGGIDAYLNPNLKGKMIASSKFHLATSTNEFVAIGVYYKPGTDLDEICEDLTSVLANVFQDGNVIVGGDFNVKGDSDDFPALREFLEEEFDIILVSDPSIPSFIGYKSYAGDVSKGKSTPDHVFMSRALLQGASCETRALAGSDHLPILVNFPSLSDFPSTSRSSGNQRLNYEKCNDLFKSRPPISEDEPSTIIIEALNSILSSALEFTPNRISPKIPWSTPRLEALKRECSRAMNRYASDGSAISFELYNCSRRKLQLESRRAKRNFSEKSVCDTILAASRHGVAGLYKTARKSVADHSANVSLDEWKSFSANLYQSYDFDEEMPKVLSAPTEKSNATLLSPFTEDEIVAAIGAQKSKAKALSGLSPCDLKPIAIPLATFLKPVFNDIMAMKVEFPEIWLDTVMFYLHKKGPTNNPSNYRSLAIENPLLKIFMYLLNARLTLFAESENILPEFQFGFRKGHSTTAAIMLLHKTIHESLSRKERVYSCFVDFKKAFDMVDRRIMFTKLQMLGIPFAFCQVLSSILQRLNVSVRANGAVSTPFLTSNGVPQGDPLSPLLYSLFIADLPDSLTHEGVRVGQLSLKYILYADDLVLLCSTANSLQAAVDNLQRYCEGNRLEINASKTKCLDFYRGGKEELSTHLSDGTILARVNNFEYLGVNITTRLSSAKHVDRIVAKCNARMGFLFSQLPLRKIPLPVAISVFNTYILPIVTYALPAWYPRVPATSKRKLDVIYNKFVKRYLGVPYSANTAITYYMTGAQRLINVLEHAHERLFLSCKYPPSMTGLTFPPPIITEHPSPPLPEYFNSCPITLTNDLPVLPFPRRALAYDFLDLFHGHMCVRGFHSHADEDEVCLCTYCLSPMGAYHRHSCDVFYDSTPSLTLREVVGGP